jgi:hypothetical protein
MKRIAFALMAYLACGLASAQTVYSLPDPNVVQSEFLAPNHCYSPYPGQYWRVWMNGVLFSSNTFTFTRALDANGNVIPNTYTLDGALISTDQQHTIDVTQNWYFGVRSGRGGGCESLPRAGTLTVVD